MLQPRVVGEEDLVANFEHALIAHCPSKEAPDRIDVSIASEPLGVTGDLCAIQTLDAASAATKGKFAIWMPRMALLPQLWGYGYYHFVLEMLPRILRAAREDPTIPILTWYNKTFIHSAFAALGVRNPIVPYRPDRAFGAASCMTVTETLCGRPSREDVRLLRDAVGARDGDVGAKCIILWRDPKTRRAIVNHDALVASLRAAFPGEDWVEFKGEGTFQEQVALFRDAKLVIGAHGAGMANLAFAPPTARVIEFMIIEETNICHWHTSAMVSDEAARRHVIVMTPTDDEMRRMRVDVESALSIVGEAIPTFKPPITASPALLDLFSVERPRRVGVIATDGRILATIKKCCDAVPINNTADAMEDRGEFDAFFINTVDSSAAADAFGWALMFAKQGSAIYVENADERLVGACAESIEKRWPNAFKLRA